MSKQRIAVKVLVLLLFSGCHLPDKLPGNISEIDTLSAYKHWSDSILKARTKLKPDSVHVSDSVNPPEIVEHHDSTTWCIVEASFKVKENALRKQKDLTQLLPVARIVVFDDVYVTTLGSFTNRDSARTFLSRNRNALAKDAFVSFISPQDSVLAITN